MRKPTHANIGPIVGAGSTQTEAKANALASASRLLTQLDRIRPQLVGWKDSVSLVYPFFTSDGELLWVYTNPRTVGEVSRDAGREWMGTAGYWKNASEARSAALNHLIQNDPAGIPADLPDDLTPRDRENLTSLRALRPTLAA
jgi:hypothetical protein